MTRSQLPQAVFTFMTSLPLFVAVFFKPLPETTAAKFPLRTFCWHSYFCTKSEFLR